MVDIPEKLNNPNFRFILVDGKKPRELSWQNTANYSFNEFKLVSRLENGYGVVCGFGSLAVIDCDEPEIEFLALNRLPKTFTVKTGGGGKHFFYIIPDLEKKFVLTKSEKIGAVGDERATVVSKHYGEIQWKGSQVVGPNSVHPSGNKYVVVGDYAIATISNQHIKEVFEKFITPNTQERTYQGENPHQYIDLSKIVNLENFRQKGGEYVGKHPIHGSSTGGNFSINIEKGLWHCFRCGTGGGAVTLIAMLNGFIQCNNARIGCITPEIREQVVQIAKIKYNLIIED